MAPINEKITDLTELTSPADGDYLPIVDVSDLTDDPAGSSKKIKKINLSPSSSSIYLNVKDYGAVGDGSTNDSTVINNLISSVSTKGGTIYFPNTGNPYKCNITVNSSYITLMGDGGVVLKPYDLTKPVITIGDGSSQITRIHLTNLELTGDGATTTSDGLVINGGNFCSYDNFSVNNFGRDNIRLQSWTNSSLYNNWFGEFASSGALRHNFNVLYGGGDGGGFTTYTYLSNARIGGGQGVSNSYGLHLGGAQVYMSNVYFEGGKGHIIYMSNYTSATYGQQVPRLMCENVTLETSGSGEDIFMDMDSTNNFYYMIQGDLESGGYVKWNDGVTTNWVSGGILPYYCKVSSMAIATMLAFGYGTGQNPWEVDFGNTVNMAMWGDSANDLYIRNLLGDVRFDMSSGKGIVLKSPNGTHYRITVANGGSLTTTSI